jgi:hypothetical protein
MRQDTCELLIGLGSEITKAKSSVEVKVVVGLTIETALPI